MSNAAVAISTGNFSADLLPSVSQWIPAGLERYPDLYSQMYDVRQSNQNTEIIYHTTGMGLAAPKEQQGRIVGDSIQQFYKDQFQNVVYGKKWAITMEAQRDFTTLKDVGKRATESATETMKVTKDILATRLLNNAFSTTVVPAYGDGKALCVSDHPDGVGGTYSNVITAPGVISETTLEQVDINVRLMKDNAGIQGLLKPQKLVIHPAEVHNVNRILNSEGRSGTADNDLNSLKSNNTYSSVIVNPYLSDSRTFFVLTNAQNGLIHFSNMSLQLKGWDDNETMCAIFALIERYCFGAAEKRHVIGVNGA